MHNKVSMRTLQLARLASFPGIPNPQVMTAYNNNYATVLIAAVLIASYQKLELVQSWEEA